MISFVKLHQVDKDLLTYVNVSDILFVEADGEGSAVYFRTVPSNGRNCLVVTESPTEIMEAMTEE